MISEPIEVAAALAAIAALRQPQRELSGYERWRAGRIAALSSSSAEARRSRGR
jgi:hypothetical protein